MPKPKRKSKSEERHKFDVLVLQVHNDVLGDTEGGSCLTRHWVQAQPHERSCRHRWQAFERAVTIDAPHYNGKCPGPDAHAWDVTREPGNHAFLSSRRPYRNQAHHIVPNALLSTAIDDATKSAASPLVALVMRMGLSEAQYNINHKTNMIVLPMGAPEGVALSLPVHTRPATATTNRGNHTDYDNLVRQELQPVIDEYMRMLANWSGGPADHPGSPDRLAKGKLMRVSSKLRKKIFDWGEAAPGSSLDDGR